MADAKATTIIEIHGNAYEEWTQIYMHIARLGWKNMPKEFLDLPIEERTGILRGMMVDAGKSGLLPSLNQVCDIMTGRAKPRASLAEETAAPTQVPKAEAPAEAPKPAEAGQQRIPEAPESVPSPGTKSTGTGPRMATEKQVATIRDFCKHPNLKAVVAETLRMKRLGNVEGLSISEASDLIAKLYDIRDKRIPPGAKVETGVKA